MINWYSLVNLYNSSEWFISWEYRSMYDKFFTFVLKYSKNVKIEFNQRHFERKYIFILLAQQEKN